ncbi:hypothetical protein DFJ74DRAFT_642610 [Hyaloraphidium curvatum]|nr:hypothetical protein DFJ74DRAFT_718160 [Hyaloraphidium curvatum]KAI9025611.1 hypothetical protein DFJ74DRAFT_642610 [Hyaloraphidium curvatum]
MRKEVWRHGVHAEERDGAKRRADGRANVVVTRTEEIPAIAARERVLPRQRHGRSLAAPPAGQGKTRVVGLVQEREAKPEAYNQESRQAVLRLDEPLAALQTSGSGGLQGNQSREAALVLETRKVALQAVPNRLGEETGVRRERTAGGRGAHRLPSTRSLGVRCGRVILDTLKGGVRPKGSQNEDPAGRGSARWSNDTEST